MTPSRTWRSSNGSIMPCSSAIFLIQRSALIDGIGRLLVVPAGASAGPRTQATSVSTMLTRMDVVSGK